MKYPAILSHSHNEAIKVLVYGQFNGANAIHIDGPLKGKRVNYCTDDAENITHEYLTNTFGKVESKEHAEFIAELAKNHDVDIEHRYNSNCKYFNFYICGEKLTLAFLKGLEAATSYGEGEITIPMPPKCDNQAVPAIRFKADSVKFIDVDGNETSFGPGDVVEGVISDVKDTDANIIITDATPTVNDCAVDRDFYPPPLNNGDNLLFGGKDKCKEWPAVGDEVVYETDDEPMSHEDCNLDEHCIVDTWKSGDKLSVIAVVLKHGENTPVVQNKRTQEVSSILTKLIKKPKTPEEELRDEIASDLNKMQLVSNLVKANELMAKYNITKKPQ